MKNYHKILFISLAFIFLQSCNNEESSIDTEIKLPVSIISLKPQSIARFIETTGTVFSTKEAVLKSELSGIYVLQVNPDTGKPFALGDFVKKGQLLIKLDDKEFENNLQIDAKKLNLETSNNNYVKQQSLYEKGGVTLSELKTASIDYINAKYSYENAEIQLEKMSVRTPFDGIIVALPYHTNSVRIDQGLDLFKIMKYDKLRLDINLPENRLMEIKKNQQVHITNYTMTNDTIQGRISQISPVIDPETRTFQSVITIDNEEMRLRPGMFVKAAILSEQRDETIVIPKDVIISKQNGMVVFTVENGIASEKTITTGLENQDYIEVIDGLKVNDRLVVAGFETLRNKSKVSVIQ